MEHPHITMILVTLRLMVSPYDNKKYPEDKIVITIDLIK